MQNHAKSALPNKLKSDVAVPEDVYSMRQRSFSAKSGFQRPPEPKLVFMVVRHPSATQLSRPARRSPVPHVCYDGECISPLFRRQSESQLIGFVDRFDRNALRHNTLVHRLGYVP